jgi:hypothetical protein
MSGLRFTNPEKWLTPRFRKLSPNQKLLYEYICQNCDLAGFMILDADRIHFDTGIETENIILDLEELNKEEISIQDECVFVIDYIEAQKNVTKEGTLNPLNNAHKNIIRKLKENYSKFENCLRTQNNLAPYEEHFRGSGKGNTIGKGNDSSNGNGTQGNTPISKRVWKMKFDCNVCKASKGEECKFKGDCHFPQHIE